MNRQHKLEPITMAAAQPCKPFADALQIPIGRQWDFNEHRFSLVKNVPPSDLLDSFFVHDND
jgi:hypothetical protein